MLVWIVKYCCYLITTKAFTKISIYNRKHDYCRACRSTHKNSSVIIEGFIFHVSV